LEVTVLTVCEIEFPFKGLRDAGERLLRPSVGFSGPTDVLKDPWLDPAEKRAILSSWASDACAVEGRPSLRWAPRPQSRSTRCSMRSRASTGWS